MAAEAGVPVRYRGARMSDLPRAMAVDIRDAWTAGKGLILEGPNGSGKTYASCAYLRATYLATGITPKFEYVPDLMAKARVAIAEDRLESFVQRYIAERELVLDDLASLRGTEFAVETLIRIIDNRYRDGKRTCVTVDVPMEVIYAQNARVAGRVFENSLLVTMNKVRPERNVEAR